MSLLHLWWAVDTIKINVDIAVPKVLMSPSAMTRAWAFWSICKRMEKENPSAISSCHPCCLMGGFKAMPTFLLVSKLFQGYGHWKQSHILIHLCPLFHRTNWPNNNISPSHNTLSWVLLMSCFKVMKKITR